MKKFNILKKEKGKNTISLLLKDEQKNFNFWIDCRLIDGFGNHKDFKTNELYIDWEFNQYIFYLTDDDDILAKKYQEDAENIEAINEYIDNITDELVKECDGE